jgi:predicted GIY-YIG superfamily endonuclease
MAVESHGHRICCYVLVTEDCGASYCGITDNFERRLRQHRMGCGLGGAQYTSARRHRNWRPLCVVRGFANRSQCLSFEWRLKRTSVCHKGGCIARRAHQLVRTLHNPLWWLRYPPRPMELYVDWLSPTHLPETTPCDEIRIVWRFGEQSATPTL